MATVPIAGTASFFLNGASYALRGEFTYQPTVDKRETIVGMDGVHGPKVTPGIGQIKAKLTNMPDLDVVGDLCGIGVRIVIDLVNGKTVTGDSMWSTEPPTVDATEGTVEVTWEGAQVTEQAAS